MSIVRLKVDTWNKCPNKDCEIFLNKLEKGDFDDKINYSEVWYDMATVYCITTTEEFMKEHHIEKLQVSDILYKITVFKNYFPLYNPNNFGCHYCDEYNGYEPKI